MPMSPRLEEDTPTPSQAIISCHCALSFMHPGEAYGLTSTDNYFLLLRAFP